MQEKITLLQKEQVDEEEEDEANHSIFIEELEDCSLDKLYLQLSNKPSLHVQTELAWAKLGSWSSFC